jgi:hypothetical protein
MRSSTARRGALGRYLAIEATSESILPELVSGASITVLSLVVVSAVINMRSSNRSKLNRVDHRLARDEARGFVSNLRRRPCANIRLNMITPDWP